MTNVSQLAYLGAILRNREPNEGNFLGFEPCVTRNNFSEDSPRKQLYLSLTDDFPCLNKVLHYTFPLETLNPLKE